MDVTPEKLAKAVDGVEVVVDLTGGAVVPGTWTGAKIRYPGSFATAVFARLGVAPHPPYCCGDPDCGGCHKEPCAHAGAGPALVAGDLELCAIAACMAAVGPLPDSEAGLSSGPVWRVLRYVAERYGYVLCTED